MTHQKLKLEDFDEEKLSKKQQKTIQGGDDPEGPDPVKETGGNGNP